MPFIDIIEPGEASGELKQIYDDLKEKRGKLAKIHKIQSLHPETIANHMDLYMTLMFGQSPLRRPQREMMAIVVSAVNECTYCQMHHAEALRHYWKDGHKVEQLQTDYRQVELSRSDALLCELARALTLKPNQIQEEKHIQPLKDEGFSDRAILDAVLIVSYFNFVNRVVEGLGLETDEEEMSGYKY